MSDIHPTAIVDAAAVVGEGCTIGPYCLIGAHVRLGPGCHLDGHVVVRGPATLGARTRVHAFAVLGDVPQRKVPGTHEPTGGLVLGEDNVIREHVTVHRGSVQDTRIGSRCLLMAGAHVAHDVVLGDDVILANGVQLAGHVVVEDFVTMGGMAGVAQRVRVGESAFVAAGAMCERDVPPFVIVQGDRARVRAINRVGLERRGVGRETLQALRRVFRRIYVGRALPSSAAHEDALVARFLAAHLRS